MAKLMTLVVGEMIEHKAFSPWVSPPRRNNQDTNLNTTHGRGIGLDQNVPSTSSGRRKGLGPTPGSPSSPLRKPNLF